MFVSWYFETTLVPANFANDYTSHSKVSTGTVVRQEDPIGYIWILDECRAEHVTCQAIMNHESHELTYTMYIKSSELSVAKSMNTVLIRP